jgi:hypothetical protein
MIDWKWQFRLAAVRQRRAVHDAVNVGNLFARQQRNNRNCVDTGAAIDICRCS